MRLTSFSDTVERARVKHPNNLGTFIYTDNDPNIHAWNIVRSSRVKLVCISGDQHRWFDTAIKSVCQ